MSLSADDVAKIAHLARLAVPDEHSEALGRELSNILDLVAQMDAEGFGGCTNHLECEAVCPKSVSSEFIAKMNREWLAATIKK